MNRRQHRRRAGCREHDLQQQRQLRTLDRYRTVHVPGAQHRPRKAEKEVESVPMPAAEHREGHPKRQISGTASGFPSSLILCCRYAAAAAAAPAAAAAVRFPRFRVDRKKWFEVRWQTLQIDSGGNSSNSAMLCRGLIYGHMVFTLLWTLQQ